MKTAHHGAPTLGRIAPPAGVDRAVARERPEVQSYAHSEAPAETNAQGYRSLEERRPQMKSMILDLD